ncbi:MAG: hypothetical protein H8D23_21225, partial [Candidatus Brocadiales bacterium]|nr:hypothetical protein [Candidatus Brocadiales bacterium]
METKKDIRSYIEKLSDDDCIGMLQDFNDRELLITIELMEKGIDPLAYGSPYRPIYAGVVYAKEGMEGIRRHHGL